jgi:hypothetical protein
MTIVGPGATLGKLMNFEAKNPIGQTSFRNNAFELIR